MTEHPNRWDLVPFTRGTGFQLGVSNADRFFPHFATCGPEGSTIPCEDLTQLPFNDDSLDFVVMRTDLPLLVEPEARRVLKPDGRLVMLHAKGGWVEGKVFGMPVNYLGRRAEGDKTACVVRYGGFGDQLQAANILPALKRAGYRVTFMTTPKGQDILRHDPHVDEWFIQDNDQVPNQELVAFWKHMATKFDRFINLSESVEGTLLAMPGRTNHAWPDAVRRRELNRNYLEWTSELAEVPYASESRFYPSGAEFNEARDYLMGWRQEEVADTPMAMTPRHFTVLWVLSGSSQHKFLPSMDTAMLLMLNQHPHVHIILTGDALCEMLEAGWEQHPRVRCESGKLSIRQTLALAQQVDVVVGPETGVLNGVAFEEHVHKVVVLSHSSHENLTKHWINATVIEPPRSIPCYPCHRLHYTREFCPEDMQSGASICAAAIKPARIAEPVIALYEDWKMNRLPRREDDFASRINSLVSPASVE